MIKLSPEKIAEYFKECFVKSDGLWFVKTEEEFGFEKALDIDEEVWKVMPKIQCRFFKRAFQLASGIDSLKKCLSEKLSIEGYKFKILNGSNSHTSIFIIEECPWHNIMLKCRNQEKSNLIGKRICAPEYSVWASEFSETLQFILKHSICSGADYCEFLFLEKNLEI